MGKYEDVSYIYADVSYIKVRDTSLANYSPINLSYFGILFPLTNSFLTSIDRVLNKKDNSIDSKTR